MHKKKHYGSIPIGMIIYFGYQHQFEWGKHCNIMVACTIILISFSLAKKPTCNVYTKKKKKASSKANE